MTDANNEAIVMMTIISLVMLAALYLIYLAEAAGAARAGVATIRRPAGILRAPPDILKKRYAKGEISKDEFDRMKNDITSD